MITNALRAALEAALSNVRAVTPVGGGDINEAARVETQDARYFVKWNHHPHPRMFEVEARGLNLLASATALRTPRVVAVIEQPAALVLDDRSGIEQGRGAEALGRGLAHQHRATAQTHGLDHDNFIGSTPQHNTPSRSWLEFYRDQRLGAQGDLAQRNGHLRPDRARRLDQVRDRLDHWIGDAKVVPSLLHGDLVGQLSGRYAGNPVLIDPAVYYGDREAEIAFTELFGDLRARSTRPTMKRGRWTAAMPIGATCTTSIICSII
jgi:fructosamine-3-kinase